MNNKELIELEFNKKELSTINLHKIFGAFIKNHKVIHNEKNRMQYEEMFTKNSFIISLLDFFKKENSPFSHSFVNIAAYQSIKIHHSSGIDLDLIYKYDSSKKDTTYQIYYNDNKNVIQNVYFSTVLNTNTIIKLNDILSFNMNSRTNIKDNAKTINKISPSEIMNPDSTILKIESTFKIIGDAIIKNKLSEDLFELLNLQYDFLNKDFKNDVILYFKDSNKIEQHNQLISDLRLMDHVKKIKPKL